jgi:hypothetical protein
MRAVHSSVCRPKAAIHAVVLVSAFAARPSLFLEIVEVAGCGATIVGVRCRFSNTGAGSAGAHRRTVALWVGSSIPAV